MFQDIDPSAPNYVKNASHNILKLSLPNYKLPDQDARLAAWDAYTEKSNAPKYTGNGKLHE